MLKKIFKGLLFFLATLLLLALAMFGRIDRTPLTEQSFYQEEMKLLDTLTFNKNKVSPLQAGWAKINITPTKPMPMAGYIPRDKFDTIHDSIYVRLLFLSNEELSTVLINTDLLLFPPTLKIALNEKLQQHNLNIFPYFSASHTHNGVGAWDDSFGGQIAIGNYDEEWVNNLADKIISAIKETKLKPASISYWESDADALIRNRIAFEKGKKDGMIRGLVIEREDSTTAAMFTYGAHATAISKHDYSISADYPGVIINNLEKQYNFGMYMAGMVGSHSFIWFPELNYELIDVESKNLYAVMDTIQAKEKVTETFLQASQIPITFGPSQLRIGKDWKLRNWVLYSVLGGLEGELTYLRIGNTLMIGTPCDFSGEIAVNAQLHEYAKSKGLNLIITSFNGNYVGYITYDGHYDSINRSEIREMNWVGPYYGQYFTDMIKKLVDKSTVERPQSTETKK